MVASTDEPCCKPKFWVYLITCVAIVMFSGLVSGLTMGLMSLSQVDLEVLVKAGQPQDRKNAAKILPVIKNQHLLLCTLLVSNSLAMEALPIFLDSILPAWGAVLISVTLILVFGEIIPQAVCSRYGLSIGAKMVMVVRLLLFIFFPITYPISKLLDWLLGKRQYAILRRAELKTLVNMHGDEAGKGGDLTRDETNIIAGALDLTQKTVKDAMTPISKIFSLDINSKLDMRTIRLIMTKGHSRVPIYSGRPTNIIGLVLVKNLIICRPEDETPIRNLTIRKIPRVHSRLPLYEIMNEFQKGHSHMAVVINCKKDDKESPKKAKDKISILGKRMNLPHIQEEETGRDSQLDLDEKLDVVTASSSVQSDVAETPSPELKKVTEKDEDKHQQWKKWEQRGDNYVLETDLDSIPIVDEEVIGIITMEDVIEELLQEEIFDETDEHMDLNNKIRINMLTPRRSPISAGAASLSHFQNRTPVASPLSPYRHTPILRSPISPYIQSPIARPTLYSSPGKSLSSSVSELAGPGQNSPASHKVSRKPYEKLRKLEGV